VTALLKLIVVFAGIIILLGRRWNLGLVLLLASLAIALLFDYPLLSAGLDVVAASTDPLTLRLSTVVVLVMILGELLRRAAALKGVVESLQTLIPSERIVMAALPALVGLLPMIGGAMFSAPMVDEVGSKLEVDGERKTFVNYWFRHIWEPILPIYPSMMLAAALLDLTTTQLARATWPLTMAAVVGGFAFGLLRLPKRRSANPTPSSRRQSLQLLATSVWPVVLVIVLSFALHIDDRLNLVVSLLATIALTMMAKRIPLHDLWAILSKHIPWKTMLVIFGALIFRRALENSGAVLAVSDDLTSLHISPATVAFMIPFVVGLLTGLVVAAFSVGFPVVLPLVIGDGGVVASEWVRWLMAGGFIGVMCSPMHLCLALTRIYFRAEWGKVYRLIAPAAFLVVATAAAMLRLV
jgi:integral membrane protein (TIGR00529 family)